MPGVKPFRRLPRRLSPTLSLFALLASALAAQAPAPLALPEEKHLRNVRQITPSGENAEAYFSADGRWLIYQSAGEGVPCDQIFIVPAEGTASDRRRVSNGQGKTTCGYFFPKGNRILYSSTHLGSPECPPRPDYSRGYVWALYADYDIFTARRDGSSLRRLTATPGYDAEATVSANGRRIVFTSVRDGDLDIYSMKPDGTDVRQLTH